MNEEETWKTDKVEPICADNDFMLHFKGKDSIGVHAGKKHFKSVEEAEAYVWMLDINGFSVEDL